MNHPNPEQHVQALDKLLQAAEEVQRYGAQTGPQWVRLTGAIMKARSDLAKMLSTPPAPASQGDSDECAEILSNLIANIEENGLYSEEGMLTFLTQALSCLKPANAAHPSQQEDDPDASDLNGQLCFFWGSAYWSELLRKNPAVDDKTTQFLFERSRELNQLRFKSQQEDGLRKAVQLMAGLLKDGEWAEILSSDPDVAALEAEISRLIGAQQEDDVQGQEQGGGK